MDPVVERRSILSHIDNLARENLLFALLGKVLGSPRFKGGDFQSSLVEEEDQALFRVAFKERVQREGVSGVLRALLKDVTPLEIPQKPTALELPQDHSALELTPDPPAERDGSLPSRDTNTPRYREHNDFTLQFFIDPFLYRIFFYIKFFHTRYIISD